MLEVLRRHTGVKILSSDLPVSCFAFRQVKLSWLDFTGIVSVEKWSNAADNQVKHTLKGMFYSLLFRPLRFLTSKWLFWVPYNFSPKFSGRVFPFSFSFFNCIQVALAQKWWKKNVFHVASWHCLFQFMSLRHYQVLQYFNYKYCKKY